MIDQMSARLGGLKRTREVLGFPLYKAIRKFHYAHRVRGRTVVGEDKLRDPQVPAADDALDGKTLRVWLNEAAFLIFLRPRICSPDCGYSSRAFS